MAPPLLLLRNPRKLLNLNLKSIIIIATLKDGDQCNVIAGTHNGKSGRVSDINLSKTGHITITITQDNNVRFKTLGKNVIVKS